MADPSKPSVSKVMKEGLVITVSHSALGDADEPDCRDPLRDCHAHEVREACRDSGGLGLLGLIGHVFRSPVAS